MERFPFHHFDLHTRERLELYAEELLKWSKTYNLIGPCTREVLFDRHFQDGVLLLDHVATTRTLADIGSGAGLPGIVVALLAEHIETLCLIEPRKKRVRFLNHVVQLLQLNKVTVFHGLAKEAAKRWNGTFDTVVSRGLGDLILGAREAWPLLAPGGTHIAFKGSNYPLEQQQFTHHQISACYDAPKILYESMETGNRMVALIKKEVCA
ncbi:MAG: 16S rRNA (guanine(527)-N(7))-methyltransferase RsmG [Magnetococcales bacterium]|nr:16S rRNA (guanine(527)-N(7))-methyltransferase RsmG [Magnetococcales bacterium]